MAQEKTVKCPICGEPYVFMPFYSGDLLACPKYKEKARKILLSKWRNLHD